MPPTILSSETPADDDRGDHDFTPRLSDRMAMNKDHHRTTQYPGSLTAHHKFFSK